MVNESTDQWVVALRAGREVLGWSHRDLALQVGLTTQSVKSFEDNTECPSYTIGLRMQRAYEKYGVNIKLTWKGYKMTINPTLYLERKG